MRSIKRLLAVILALVLLIGAVPAAGAVDLADTGVLSDSGTIGTCKWSLYGDTLTISNDSGGVMDNFDEGEALPYDQYKQYITAIVIKNGVTDVGSYTFTHLENVEKLTIESGVRAIGNNAFADLTKLKAASLPDTVTRLGEGAFYNTGILSLKLSSNLSVIKPYTFADCAKLKSVTIPDSVTEIQEFAFCNYAAIKNKNNYVAIKNKNNGKDLIPDYVLETVTLSKNLTSIGDYAFSDCKSLTGVTMPDTLTALGVSAFENCSSLRTAVLSRSLAEVPDCAFNSCTSLTAVDIPRSVKRIGIKAFCGCVKLDDAHLNDGIETVASYAFYGTAMTSVTIPPSVTDIQKTSFAIIHPEKYTYTQGDLEIHTIISVGDPNFIVYGVTGSAAEKYANSLRMSFYKVNYFRMYFNANGGYGEMDSIRVRASDEFYLPECTFMPPEGKEFHYWSTDRFGRSDQYEAGATFQTSGGAYDFYAIWEAKAPANTLTSIGIAGFPEVTAGKSAADNPPAGTPGQRGYTITDRKWCTAQRVNGSVTYTDFTGTFVEGQTYFAFYTIYPNKSYKFASTVTVEFSDGTVRECSSRPGFVNPGVGVTCAAKQNYTVNSVSLKITEPTAGVKPDFTVTKTSRAKCDVYQGLGLLALNGTGLEFIDHSKGEMKDALSDIALYMTKDETFKAGNTYTARIFLDTFNYADTYFGKQFTATVNGNAAVTSDTSGGKETLAWVDYTFTLAGSTLVGDVNEDGEVTNRDAMILDRYIAGWTGYEKNIKNMDAADMDRKGTVDNRDAMILDRVVAGWPGYYDKYCITV